MATPTYIGKSAFASGTGALSVGAVAGVQANDLLLMFVESANQAVSIPAGWTPVPSSPQFIGTSAAAGGVRLTAFYEWAAGADGTDTVADSGDHTTAIKIAVRGVDKANPFNASAGSSQAATTAMSWPGVTTTVDECLIVLGCAQDTDAASTATSGTPSNANLANLTERHDQTVTAGAGGGLVILTGEKATAGATGNTTSTGSTSVTHAYITLALAPIALAAITGDLAANESGADAFAGAGDVQVQGGLSAAETGQDSFAATGAVGSSAATGDMAAAESGADVLAGTGSVLVRGTAAAAEAGNDTFGGAGKVLVAGGLAAAETGGDTFAGTGQAIVAGTLAATEAGTDTFAAAGGVTVQGTLAAVEAGQDEFAGTGSGITVTAGQLVAVEAGADTFAAAGAVPARGSLVAAETGDDVAAAAGAVPVQGVLLAAEDGQDALAGSGSARNGYTGTMDAVEASSDSLEFTGQVLVQGAMAAAEDVQDGFAGGNVEPEAVDPPMARPGSVGPRGGPGVQISLSEWERRFITPNIPRKQGRRVEDDDEEAVLALICAMMEAA